MDFIDGLPVYTSDEQALIQAWCGLDQFERAAWAYHVESGRASELCGCEVYDDEACRDCKEPEAAVLRRYLKHVRAHVVL